MHVAGTLYDFSEMSGEFCVMLAEGELCMRV
jgi:hypothetical protein